MFEYLDKRIPAFISVAIILFFAFLFGRVVGWQYLRFQKEKFELAEIKIREVKLALIQEGILSEGAFVRDKLELNIDQDDKNEILVLYVLDKKIEEDPDPWCGNLSGEKLLGGFYLALIDENKVQSRIELIPGWFENGGEYKDKKLINPQDLNGDGKKLEFTFDEYFGCNGNLREIVGYSFNDKKLKNFVFYREGEEAIAVFVSDSYEFPGLAYENEFLIRRFYSQANGYHKVYYKWDSETEKFLFQKEETGCCRSF